MVCLFVCLEYPDRAELHCPLPRIVLLGYLNKRKLFSYRLQFPEFHKRLCDLSEVMFNDSIRT